MILFRCIWIASLLIALAGTPSARAEEKPAQAGPAKPVPTAAEVDGWISQLNDDRYLVREKATRQLLDSGTAALDQLQATVDADRPEPADRSIWILKRLSNTKDYGVKRQVLEHMANLKKRPQIATAARETLGELEHQEALAGIEQLGGAFNEDQPIPQAGGMFVRAGQLDLDSRWRGGDAGLVHLRHLHNLQVVHIIGTDISAEALCNELPHCPTLHIVRLYGTKLTPEDAAKLRKLLTERIEVDYRKGALLGVSSLTLDGAGPPVVQTVSAGSAAAIAGIQPGDRIQKFNGEDLTTFKHLTQKIGDRRPGDEVTLTVLRDKQTLEIKVKLGQWKSLDQ